MNYELIDPFDVPPTFNPPPVRVNVRSISLARPGAHKGIDVERSFCQSTKEFIDFDKVWFWFCFCCCWKKKK